MKPKNQTDYADDVEMIEEKLGDFIATITAWSSTPTFGLSGDIYKLISIQRNGNEVTELNQKEILYTENNPLTAATLNRSVYVRSSGGGITLYPSPTGSESITLTYYRQPSSPSWGYIIVNEKALYNSNQTTNFELHATEEELIVSRILQLAGIITMKPGIVEIGGSEVANTKAEQNN